MLHVAESALWRGCFIRLEKVVVSLEEAVASEPSNGSAKVISVESKEMVAFGNVNLRKEYFGLSVVLGVGPLLVPGLNAVLLAD